MCFYQVALILKAEFEPQGYSIPTKMAPNVLIKVASWFDGALKYVVVRLGKCIKLDNSRMRNVLGIEPTPMEDTFLTMAYSMVERGFAKRTSGYKLNEKYNYK